MVPVLWLMLTLVDLSQQGSVWESQVCELPDCRQYNDPEPPGSLAVSDTPQIVMVSFYGTINTVDFELYKTILEGLSNPNGCPVAATFFIDDQGTDFKLVKLLYDHDNEIGLRSKDGSVSNSSAEWTSVFKQLCNDLQEAGINLDDVHGVRAPTLNIGKNEEFKAFGEACGSLKYDSSCASVFYSKKNTTLWPYTFDEMPTAWCDIGMAPSQSFPGIWEVMITDYFDKGTNTPCAVPSACINIQTQKDAFDLFNNTFTDHYQNSRTPFNLIIDPAWAVNADKRAGTRKFLESIAGKSDDVWVVPIYKGLQWVQNPTSIDDLGDFEPWQCGQKRVIPH